MAYRKKQGNRFEELDTPFSEELLINIPIGYRFMVQTETNHIGELYKTVRFSSSNKHQSNQYTNIPSYKPLSNLILQSEDEEESIDK